MILAGAIGLQEDAATEARRACELPNPEWHSWIRRKSRGHAPSRYIVAERRVLDWCLFPRNFPGSEALQLQDRRVLPESSAERRLLWGLRDYQEEALQAWLSADGDGIIEAPCGAGKTLIGCAALCSVRTPALILVHTRDLASQWRCRLEEACSGIEIGEICSGKDQREADVVIATLQSLARWSWADLVQFGRTRGLVIVDEAHHIPAETFSRVMLSQAGRYRLGLTATPERADSLTPLLHWTMGQTAHIIDRRLLQADGHVMVPEIQLIQTKFTPTKTEPHERKRELSEDTARNALLCDLAMRLADDGRRVLLLVDLVFHARALAAALTLQDTPAAALVGDMSSTIRAARLRDLKAGTLAVLVATSLADEGLDLPELDAVILGTPSGNVARVEQRIGRVLRQQHDKRRPIVLDLIDAYGIYRGYSKRRQNLYRQRGWM